MPWLERKSEAHLCENPKYGESKDLPAHTGDVWQCPSCLQKWCVVSVNFGDQRDPIPQGYIQSWVRGDGS